MRLIRILNVLSAPDKFVQNKVTSKFYNSTGKAIREALGLCASKERINKNYSNIHSAMKEIVNKY